jgi:hypothetical protein
LQLPSGRVNAAPTQLHDCDRLPAVSKEACAILGQPELARVMHLRLGEWSSFEYKAIDRTRGSVSEPTSGAPPLWSRWLTRVTQTSRGPTTKKSDDSASGGTEVAYRNLLMVRTELLNGHLLQGALFPQTAVKPRRQIMLALPKSSAFIEQHVDLAPYDIQLLFKRCIGWRGRANLAYAKGRVQT